MVPSLIEVSSYNVTADLASELVPVVSARRRVRQEQPYDVSGTHWLVVRCVDSL